MNGSGLPVKMSSYGQIILPSPAEGKNENG